MHAWHGLRGDSADTSRDTREDHLQLLTLCVEVQLDLLLVALRPGDVALRPGEAEPRWDGETLDLTGTEPSAGSGEFGPGDVRTAGLEARFAALAEAIDEMLANAEVRRHPAVVARLNQARATCIDRLAAMPRPLAGVAESGPGDRIEAGHFLG
jgi:hypothetical protein